MGWLRIETEAGKTSYCPGEEVRGTVRWQMERQAQALEVRLFWYTRGKGTRDSSVLESKRIESPVLEGSEEFSFVFPDAPYSFSGKLISVVWAIELVVLPSDEAECIELLMSPTGQEILLPEGPAGQ